MRSTDATHLLDFFVQEARRAMNEEAEIRERREREEKEWALSQLIIDFADKIDRSTPEQADSFFSCLNFAWLNESTMTVKASFDYRGSTFFYVLNEPQFTAIRLCLDLGENQCTDLGSIPFASLWEGTIQAIAGLDI